MLVDSHAHIYLDKFDSDFEAMLDRAREAGVGVIVMPAIDIESIKKAISLSEQYDGLYAMAAIHPSETKKETAERDFNALQALCDDPGVVAVGESGLDYYWDRSFVERQQMFFRQHNRLAIEKDLPLILHNREASDDLVRILREEKASNTGSERLRGIFHCFGGPPWLVDQALDLGFFLGIGGTLTFKNSGVAEIVREIPLEHLVLETDAPFLAPVPYRGKRNEPAYVRLVAERLAEIKGLSVEEVAEVTMRNAVGLFGIDASKTL